MKSYSTVKKPGLSYFLAIIFVLSLIIPIEVNNSVKTESQESVARVSTPSQLTVHDRIIITSDSDFATEALAEGWDGDGSMGNPYIIENYSITSDGGCIGINDVTVNFIIRGCLLTSNGNQEVMGDDLIHGAQYAYGGRHSNTVNSMLYNDGITLWNVKNATIANNTLQDNIDLGVLVYNSNCTMINNTISNSQEGIHIIWSSGCSFTNTSFENCGVRITSTSLDHWNHEFVNNTVNGLPLNFTTGVTNSQIDASSYGQLILVDSKDVTVSNGDFDNVTSGILVGYSTECEIRQSSFSNNSIIGLDVSSSNNTVIANNDFQDNLYGLFLRESFDCTIENNTFKNDGLCVSSRTGSSDKWRHSLDNNTVNSKQIGYFYEQEDIEINASDYGQIIIGDCQNVTVKDGEMQDVCEAVMIGHSDHCIIRNMTIHDTAQGISLISSDYCEISNCTIYNTYDSNCIRLMYSDYFLVYNNSLSQSIRGLYFAYCHHSFLNDNEIFGNALHGIFVIGDASNDTLCGNTVYDNTYDGGIVGNRDPGIALFSVRNFTIVDNEVYGNNGRGIAITGTNLMIITRNTVYENLDNGIGCGPSFSIISYNTVYNNGGEGIQVGGANSTIFYNKAYNNRNGIYAGASSSNLTLFGNIMTGNTIGNGVDDGANNTWFSERVGNQWGDWSGTGQYNISGTASNADLYPLAVAPRIDTLNPIDTDSPLIDYSVTWNAIGFNPDKYSIYWNDEILDDGDWDGWAITFEISVIDTGFHNLSLVVNDTNGNSAMSSLLINYTSTATTTTTTTTTTPTTTTTTATTTSPSPGQPLDPMLVVVLAGGAALFLLLIIVIAGRKRRGPKPPVVAPVEPSPEEPAGEVQVLRGCAPVGGKFEYKVKVKNDTRYFIHDITVTIVSYPDDCMELSGDPLKKIAKIDPGGFRSPQFTFIPTKDCVEGQILSSVSFVDHEGTLESVEVEPIVIRSVCDLLEPLETTMEEFELLLGGMSVTREEREMEWNPEVLYRKAEKLLPNRNFHILEAESSSDEGLFRGVIRGLAEGKYTRKKVAVRIVITGKEDGAASHVVVEGLGEDAAMLPTTIEEITSGIDAWICLNCGGGLGSDEVDQILAGQTVECQYCKRAITIHLFRK